MSSYLQGSLSRLEGTTTTTTENVSQVQKMVPAVATDLQRINAIPDGAWARVNPFRYYRVTKDVKETIGRAMAGVTDSRKQEISDALAALQDKDKMQLLDFRQALSTKCPGVHELLEQWLPLIMKVSRIPE
jgi:hypothetical protein